MKTEIVHFNEKNTNLLQFENYLNNGSTNENSRIKMKNILSKAICDELTERQRICITQYFLHGKKEKEIAKELSLNPSTVSRHIATAKKRLRRIASYYSA